MKKLNGKILSLIMCIVIPVTSVMGCGVSDTVYSNPDPTIISSDTVNSSVATDLTEATTEAITPWFTFETKVCSSFHEGVYGKKMCDAWYSLVDAVLAGEDTFSCPDGHTYVWVMRDFPEILFPVMKDLIDTPESYDLSTINGTAKIKYLVSKEEAAQKIAEFEKLVEDIINSVIRPEYTEFEKALALYSYFTHTYVYDYDAARAIDNNEVVTYTSSYRLLTTKTGVCGEISQAYSYLLLQVGVDASTVSGQHHEWSIINLGGKYYHIDPTFGIQSWDSMAYFMMTDEQRADEGGYLKKNFQYVGEYHPEVLPDYSANDDSFKSLYGYFYESFDHATSKVTCWKYKDDTLEEKDYIVFDYSAFP